MPTPCTFFGIVIQMYAREPGRPHFHAWYSGQVFVIEVSPILVKEGNPSPRTKSMLVEWAALHQTELLAAWDALRAGKEPSAIAPLE